MNKVAHVEEGGWETGWEAGWGECIRTAATLDCSGGGCCASRARIHLREGGTANDDREKIAINYGDTA